LNRLDRGAVLISTSGKVVQPSDGKGITAEVECDCPIVFRWVVREHLPDCHKNFVKRYHWLIGCPFLGMPYFPWTAYQSGSFLLQSGLRPKKERLIVMKKMLSLVLALALVAVLAVPTVQTQADTVASGVEDGVLTIAMECAYAPYNWTQSDDSNGAVPISNVPGSYANGYDVMIGKKICEANGWKLEVIQSDWDSLVPGVQTGTFDAVIAGQSMTAERAEQVDFAGPYFYASIVCVTKADSKFADAASIADLAGGTCTAQIATIWYDQCLPQITGAAIQPAAETAPAMLMALETGMVDFICTDMPTAQGAVAAYPDMKILDFSGTDGDFQFSEEVRAENVNIGISLMKGNTVLKEAIDQVLSAMTADDFNELMAQAIAIQPLSE